MVLHTQLVMRLNRIKEDCEKNPEYKLDWRNLSSYLLDPEVSKMMDTVETFPVWFRIKIQEALIERLLTIEKSLVKLEEKVYND